MEGLPKGTYSVRGQVGDRLVQASPGLRLRMCSTMKLPLLALVLQEHQRGRMSLTDTVTWTASDIIGHSPFTRSQTAPAASVKELCEAIGLLSDNTATNLLLRKVGGPSGLTDYARALGDQTTRFDRYETDMNRRDGIRDTTTAAAFATLARTLFENLEPRRASSLRGWLPARDGRRIGAAAPPGVELIHKTGTSGDGAVNDVAVFFREGRTIGSLAIFTDAPNGSDETVTEIARRSLELLRPLGAHVSRVQDSS